MKIKNDEEKESGSSSIEKKFRNVTARVPVRRYIEFKKIANSWGIGSGAVLRKLINHVVLEKISLLDLLRLSNTEVFVRGKGQYKTICARLSEREIREFCAISEEWDFAPGTLAKLLVQYFLEIDDKDSLWA
jgi:hypothetical protein